MLLNWSFPPMSIDTLSSAIGMVMWNTREPPRRSWLRAPVLLAGSHAAAKAAASRTPRMGAVVLVLRFTVARQDLSNHQQVTIRVQPSVRWLTMVDGGRCP